VEEQKKGMSKGCMVALIIVGIIAVIVIAAGIVCYIYKDEIIQKSMQAMVGVMSDELKANLPPDISEEEADQTLNRFNEAVRNNEVKPAQLQQLAVMFQGMMEDKKLDTAESRQLINELRKITGMKTGGPAEEDTTQVDSTGLTL
jgi:hypothetical protein